jgi:hypothetical protein
LFSKLKKSKDFCQLEIIYEGDFLQQAMGDLSDRIVLENILFLNLKLTEYRIEKRQNTELP